MQSQQQETPNLTPLSTHPPAPRTKRGDFSSLDIANDHLLYFNGPTLILRPLNPQKQPKYFVHKSDVLAARFSYNGKFIASIDEKGTLMVHELGGGGLFEGKKYENFYAGARAIEWSADQKRVCVVGAGKSSFGRVALIESGTNAGEITGVSANLTCCTFRPQRPYNLVVGGDQFVLKFYQGPPYKFLKSTPKVHTSYINTIKYSPLGTYLLSTSSDKKILLFDGLTFQLIKQKSNCHDRSILGADWIDEERFVTVGADKTIKVWGVGLEEQGVVMCGTVEEMKDAKSVERFQVAVKVYKGMVYSLSLNGEIVGYEVPGKGEKVVQLDQRKMTRYAGWLDKPTAVVSVTTPMQQKHHRVYITDSTGRILSIPSCTSSSQSTVTLLPQDYPSPCPIITATSTPQQNLINLLWADGSLSQVQINQSKGQLLGQQPESVTRIAHVEGLNIRMVAKETIGGEGVVAVGERVYWLGLGKEEKVRRQSQVVGEDVTAIQVSQRLIFIGTIKGNLLIYDSQTFQLITKTNLSSTKLSCISIQPSPPTQQSQQHLQQSPSSSLIIITGNALGKLTITRFTPSTVAFQQLPCTLGNHQSLITSILPYKNGQFLFTCAMDNTINLWRRVAEGKYSRMEDWRSSHQLGVLVAEVVGQELWTVGGEGLVKRWGVGV